MEIFYKFTFYITTNRIFAIIIVYNVRTKHYKRTKITSHGVVIVMLVDGLAPICAWVSADIVIIMFGPV